MALKSWGWEVGVVWWQSANRWSANTQHFEQYSQGNGLLGRLLSRFELVSGSGGAGVRCCFCFWVEAAVCDSLDEGACFFLFPSLYFDPGGDKSGHRNRSVIFSGFLCLSMP